MKETITSFTIDHDRLKRGLYVSRRDAVGSETITTFDIRMKVPNRPPYLTTPASHTIEHLGAVYLRNNPEWEKRIIYFGPMGCRTGFYLLAAGSLSSMDVADLLRDMFRHIAEFRGEVPGTTSTECGNYRDHDLAGAQQEASVYLHEVLEKLDATTTEYP